eukprot:scaffold205676_cov22-Tisochrysis_lutea.AAC.1
MDGNLKKEQIAWGLAQGDLLQRVPDREHTAVPGPSLLRLADLVFRGLLRCLCVAHAGMEMWDTCRGWKCGTHAGDGDVGRIQGMEVWDTCRGWRCGITLGPRLHANLQWVCTCCCWHCLSNLPKNLAIHRLGGMVYGRTRAYLRE